MDLISSGSTLVFSASDSAAARVMADAASTKVNTACHYLSSSPSNDTPNESILRIS